MQVEYSSNLQWADAAHSCIDMIVKFTSLQQEVPFTANPLDNELHGRFLYSNAIAGTYGPIADYTPAGSNSMLHETTTSYMKD
jgi:hypothetical protein